MTTTKYWIKINSRKSKLSISNKTVTCRKSKEAKVNNFYLIEDALRKIKVKFDGKMMHQIMEEERGVVLRLLY